MMAPPNAAAFVVAFIGVPIALLAGLTLVDLMVGAWRKFHRH